MAFRQTSAHDIAELLSEIKSFALSIGFLSPAEKLVPGSGSYSDYLNLRLSLSKGNCHITIATYGRQNDDKTLRLGLDPTNPKANYNPETCTINDLAGPFANVWFFSPDNSSIWVVTETAPERYTHFGFGIVDKEGQTTPDCAFASGLFYDIRAYPYIPGFYRANLENIRLGTIGGSLEQAQLMIPGGVVEGVNAAVVTNNVEPTMLPGNFRSDYYTGTTANAILDIFGGLVNTTATGGTPLLSAPVIYKDSSGYKFWLGRFPGYRFVRIDNIAPGEELMLIDETWVCFPWKQKGFEDNMYKGSEVKDEVNTKDFGVAFRKIA